MKLNSEQWKELTLFLKDMVNHPMYALYKQLQEEKIASLASQGLTSDSDNRFFRGKVVGMIEQNKEFETIIINRFKVEDTSETSTKEN